MALGAGTPLGDPIEIGAAAAVLMERLNEHRETHPLMLMASKSWVGHSEPGAGMVAVAHSTLAISNWATLGITHLRAVNPYVVTSMKVQGEIQRCLP